MEHLFICLFAICTPSFGRCLFRSFARFSVGLFISLLLSSKSYLNSLDNGPWSDMSFSNIFSQSVACFFILLSRYSYTILVGSSFLDNREQNEKCIPFDLAILFLKIFGKHDQKDRYINVYCNIVWLSETDTTRRQQCVPLAWGRERCGCMYYTPWNTR